MPFQSVIEKYRANSYTERDKGFRFEKLMQGFLKTYQLYVNTFAEVWMWADFPYNSQFLGGKDIGIDLVALTENNEYWAIQCKCFAENTRIEKDNVDSFLSTSSKRFTIDSGESVRFAHRLWISTTDNWGPNAENALDNQDPPVSRLGLYDLETAAVDWDKLDAGIFGAPARTGKFQTRPDQLEAINAVHEYFKENERGKLVMACGTGKTFTALKIAEKETNGKGLILVLVPSISLVGQTLRAWTTQSVDPIYPICICSDSTVSKDKKLDIGDDSVIDLGRPATTNIKAVDDELKRGLRDKKHGLTVVFSTYQSIEVIANVQKKYPFEFDLIICDEAHRTTGVTLSGDDESAFVKIHNKDFIRGKRRLYMTATPRLYKDSDKKKAEAADAILCSMDDKDLYGEEIYRLGFGKAVELGLLSDYKVLILTLTDNDLTQNVRALVSSKDYSLNTDDAVKLIGCVNALSKLIYGDGGVTKATDPAPMKRAVAFCQNIKISKEITGYFNTVPKAYLNDLPAEEQKKIVDIESKHVDGSMSAATRNGLLSWLKSDTDNCKILCNVRCLSEGVDVPSLDAVLFLSAKGSKIDIVQSVGRVMRKAPAKKYGYIIIPVVVPSDVPAEKALDNNANYKVIWDVLNALRAHDERFEAEVEKIGLSKYQPPHIIVGGLQSDDDGGGTNPPTSIQTQLLLQYQQLRDQVYARIVLKVGDRQYWESWAKDVAIIAEKHKERLRKLVQNPDVIERFAGFVAGLRENINDSIDDEQAIEMLSQHMITKPIFEALFENNFTANNAVSQSMQEMLDVLEDNAFEKETESLNRFYESVRNTVKNTNDPAARQAIVVKLYDNFFKLAFKKVQEQLGIVYTPIEVVDFMIHSVDDILRKEFGRGLTDENVNILDPFTGTGTFIVRLLQSGLIKAKDLDRKYTREIFANEIVLLAYYIAAVNIENAYHYQKPEDSEYKPFNGICLTDTFQLDEFNEKEHLAAEYFPKNNERVKRQKNTPITVIMSNPPYSAGQKSANDNAQNMKYPKLDKRVEETYSRDSVATNKNSVHDSYINAFRWSTDRITDNGIICFVSNGGWLDGSAMDGFRKHLEQDFSSIYVFNLRGNARTSGELRKKEKDNVFGQGTRTPVTITLLVKKANSGNKKATIYYHDIGDYLSREEKLKIVNDFGSVNNSEMKWEKIHPNNEYDWINARNPIYSTFICIGDKFGNDKDKSYFVPYYSNGLKSNRDAWVINFNKSTLIRNVKQTISFFNIESDRYYEHTTQASKIGSIKSIIPVEDFIESDPKKISWSRAFRHDIEKHKKYSFCETAISPMLYRPFTKAHMYYNRELVNDMALMPKLYSNQTPDNLFICSAGLGSTKDFSVIITNILPDLGLNAACQCYPLYYYDTTDSSSKIKEIPKAQTTLNSNYVTDAEKMGDDLPKRYDGISNYIWNKSINQYSDKTITKEDIFYYVYGFLHSKEYRETFSADLKKMLARIPLVESKKDFLAFSKAGRKLADLHLNYESVAPYPDVDVSGTEFDNFKVQQMKFASVRDNSGKLVKDKSKIVFNNSITLSNIPAKAYEYVVNGKSAIEWIMERYCYSVDKDSGIVNDANDWADEVGNPRYILDLLLSIINVSVQTVDIVNGLPKLKFEA